MRRPQADGALLSGFTVTEADNGLQHGYIQLTQNVEGAVGTSRTAIVTDARHGVAHGVDDEIDARTPAGLQHVVG